MTDIVGKSAGTVSNRQKISKEDAVDIANMTKNYFAIKIEY